MKKYLIRAIGALCILAAIAVLFLTTTVNVDGIKRADLKELRTDAQEILDTTSEQIAFFALQNDSFKEDLKDNGFPSTSSAIKKPFREINDLSKSLLDESVTLKEVLTISIKAPGLIKKANNLFESKGSDVLVDVITAHTIEKQLEEDPEIVFTDEAVQEFKTSFKENAQDAIQTLSTYSFAIVALTGLLILIIALAVLSAALHICNKGRWVKYILLAIVFIIVVGGTVATLMSADLIKNAVGENGTFGNLTLRMGVMPYIALVLMFVPMVLDIIFERKFKAQVAAATIDTEDYYMPAVETVESNTATEAAETTAVCDNVDNQTDVFDTPEQPKKKRTWKFWLCSGLITAAVAAVITLLLVFVVFNNYKTPLNLWEKTMNTKKVSAVLDRQAEELNGFCEKEYKELVKIIKKTDAYEDLLVSYEDDIDYMKDEYGDNFRIKLKVTEKEEIEKEDLREARDAIREIGDEILEYYEEMDAEDYEEMAEYMGISESQAKKYAKTMVSVGKILKKAKISDGYALTVRETLTGSELDEPEEDEYETYVYKIDGRWVSEDALWMAYDTIGYLYVA